MEEIDQPIAPIVFSVTALAFLVGLLFVIWNAAHGLLEKGSLGIFTVKNTNLEESLLFYFFLVGILAIVFFTLSLFLLLTTSKQAGLLADEMTKDLLASREMFLQLYNASPVSYLLISNDNKVSLPNKASLRLFGITAQKFEDKSFLDFFQEKDLDHIHMLLARLKRDVQLPEEEIQIVRPDGSKRWVTLSMFSLRHESSMGYQSGLVTLVDITERKEVDRAKTEFVSLAAHQLRTPLSAIKWYSELLASRDIGGLNSKQEEYLEKVYAGNERMIELVNTLLNVSRLELGTLAVDIKSVNIIDLMGSSFEEFEEQIQKKSLTVHKKYDENSTLLMNTDPKLLRMVFENLISNSVKYTPSEGNIMVEIESLGSKVKITVEDSGFGIPKEQQDKIFTKLFRADNARALETKGTGLGLYIAKMIVEEFKGSVGFTSELDKGTKFVVVLPL